MQVDPRGVAGAAGRHHAFDDQHVLADGGLLIKGDDFFEQLIQLTVAEHALDMGQAQRLRRFQAVGAGYQFGGAFRARVARMRLGNRFEKPTLSPARSRVRTSPRLMEVRPTPKSVGAIKKFACGFSEGAWQR